MSDIHNLKKAKISEGISCTTQDKDNPRVTRKDKNRRYHGRVSKQFTIIPWDIDEDIREWNKGTMALKYYP